ncbi:RNA methylase [Desulfovibrio sp. X2]|uniref:THUMP domain-containing class I SAM-dependent RNA methyltransferase n=1 Tax=Desulfovibrio sp. X2 TaxID=941449 RepID=UPI000358828D|nr:RNA methyltransferase [Desulfovibrio sp. X2]EPR40862.1 RNA methylase [Desulfovibrio sp. X2]
MAGPKGRGRPAQGDDALPASSTILLTCPRGLSPFLAAEAAALGYEGRELAAGVAVTGGPLDCLRLNLHLRTAHRVLYEVARFRAPDPDALYARGRELPWEEWFLPGAAFSISSSVQNPHVRDTRFPNLRLKDAVADRFRARTGSRPDSGRERAGASVFLHWRGDDATVYLDTTGEPLARRGYRLQPHRAPMQETLAAACLLAADYDGALPLVNPMCGSGTLAIEAALIATRTAPGLLRTNFAFSFLAPFADEAGDKAWKDMRTQARRAMRPAPCPILATDIDPAAVDATRANAERAGMDEAVAAVECDFRDTPLPSDPGIIVMNPEYGQRLGSQEKLEGIYAATGDWLKQRCMGWRAFVFTGNLELAGRIGLRPSRRIPFWNAKIECRLLAYELYAGSRKSGA